MFTLPPMPFLSRFATPLRNALAALALAAAGTGSPAMPPPEDALLGRPDATVKAGYGCGLCGAAFSNAEEQRRHDESRLHVERALHDERWAPFVTRSLPFGDPPGLPSSSAPQPSAEAKAALNRAEHQLAGFLGRGALSANLEGALAESGSSASSSAAPAARRAYWEEADEDEEQPGQAEPGASLAKNLHRFNVNLTPLALADILSRHGSRASGASQFDPAFQSPASLEDLLTSGLLEGDGRAFCFTRRPFGHLDLGTNLCRHPGPVGTCLVDGKAVPTDRFLVVTLKRYEHASNLFAFDIVAAYPVAPR